jgi:hypothetical protein
MKALKADLISLVLLCNVSFFDRQPSTVNRQPPTANRQPPTVNWCP